MEKKRVLLHSEHQAVGITVCPYCKTEVELDGKVIGDVSLGSPFCTCPNCQKDYFDPKKKEVSIGMLEEVKLPLIYYIAPSIGFIAITFLIVSFILGKQFYRLQGLEMAFFVFLWLWLSPPSVFLHTALIKKIRQKPRIDYLEGRADERDPEIIESMQRLSSAEYLDALKANGVRVPKYFYQRLNEVGQQGNLNEVGQQGNREKTEDSETETEAITREEISGEAATKRSYADVADYRPMYQTAYEDFMSKMPYLDVQKHPGAYFLAWMSYWIGLVRDDDPGIADRVLQDEIAWMSREKKFSDTEQKAFEQEVLDYADRIKKLEERQSEWDESLSDQDSPEGIDTAESQSEWDELLSDRDSPEGTDTAESQRDWDELLYDQGVNFLWTFGVNILPGNKEMIQNLFKETIQRILRVYGTESRI